MVSMESFAKAHVETPEVMQSSQTSALDVIGRTTSQVAAFEKIQKVMQHLEERRVLIHDLHRTVLQLSNTEVLAVEGIELLEADLATVEEARKRARNVGEDLIEDMLVLDSLHNLVPDDRSTRKASIAGIDALLEDVDVAKSRLAALHKRLLSKLEEVKEMREAECTATKAHPTPQGEVGETALESLTLAQPQTSQTFGGMAEPKRVPPPVVHSARGPRETTSQKPKSLASEVQAPMPTRDSWRQIHLPLRFQVVDQDEQCSILAKVPGLDVEDFQLAVGDNASTLTVEGLRMPTLQVAVEMRKKITNRLQTLARHSPQQFARIEGSLNEVAAKAYAELGKDEYGHFSETFRLPQNVDVSGIDASYRDGVLRIVLPKVVPRRCAHPAAGMLGGRCFNGQRSAPFGQLGGFDDGFFW